MSLVIGRPNLLTPDEAKVILTDPLLGILRGENQPIFSQRNQSNYSAYVLILPVRRVESGLQHPLYVEGLQWERAVLPVLQDPQWQSNLIKQSSSPQYSWVRELFGDNLKASFQAAGYGARDG